MPVKSKPKRATPARRNAVARGRSGSARGRAVKPARSGAAPTMAAYLAALPAAQRAALQKLRKQIHAIAPAATEAISYGIPTFKLDGNLVAFAAFKQHLSFFPMGHRVLAPFEAELAPFRVSLGTLRFTPGAPLPAPLLRRIVKARMAENAAKGKTTGGRKR